MHGRKILLLQTLDGGQVCAVDALGAGPGEWVLYAHGSRVRDLTLGAEVADKDVVVAIVDGVDADRSAGSPMLPLTERAGR